MRPVQPDIAQAGGATGAEGDGKANSYDAGSEGTMTRDELIEELKKAPSNGEVTIVSRMVDECVQCGYTSKPHRHVFSVDRISTIPDIIIEAVE